MIKVALITGGSSGIGKATARFLTQKGYKVFELSRSGASCDNVTHVKCDVSDQISVNSAIKLILSETDRIDLLINNAGFGISGAIEFTDIDSAKRLFDVNFFGAVNLIKAVLPALRKSKGRIINVSSMGSVLYLPFQAFYSATKAALNALTLALNNEVKKFGVSVCAILPGDIKTGFTNSREKSQNGESIYNEMLNRSISTMEKDERNGMSPDKIAKKIYKISIKRGVKPYYTVGFKYKLFLFLSKTLPARLVNYIVGLLYAK